MDRGPSVTAERERERDEEETLHLRGQRQALGRALRLPFKGLRRERMDRPVNAGWYQRGTRNSSVKQRKPNDRDGKKKKPKNIIIVIPPFAEPFDGIKLDYKDSKAETHVD